MTSGAVPAPSAAPPSNVPELGDPSTATDRRPEEDPLLVAQNRAAAKPLPERAGAAPVPAGHVAGKHTPQAVPAAKSVEKASDASGSGSAEKRAAAGTGAAKGDEVAELLTFETLADFEYRAPNPDVPNGFEEAMKSIPKEIRELEGRVVSIEGFMVPLRYSETDDGVTSFLLSRFQLSCCFGLVPRANELVEVEMDPEHSAPYVSYIPITITGRIHVGPKEGDTSSMSAIFRMTAPAVTIPEAEEEEFEAR